MVHALDLVLLYLLAAVAGVVIFRFLKLPPMLGYLVVGVLIGPHALAWAQNSHQIEYLAEFGVVFLMFVIGLEFNLTKLMSMRKLVFGLGLSQVLLTISTVLVAHFAAMHLMHWLGRSWDLSWPSALALGSAMAMSSTAIVMKLLAERAELDSEHGQRVVGILLFQDLAVVPLLIMIPALGIYLKSSTGNTNLGEAATALGDNLIMPMALALAKASAILAVLLLGGQRIMRRWLNLVAKRQSEELFMLNVLLITLGLAWLTERAGLSLALGAFLAGMLIAETPYRHQVEADIRPFHDILLGLFFITIGMKLDWQVLTQRWLLVLILTLTPVLFKIGLITLLTKASRGSTGTALRTGIYLGQAGEFGFVLLTLAVAQHLIDKTWLSPVLASMVLSMLATPFMIQHADRLVNQISRRDWLQASLTLTHLAAKSMQVKDHVVIIGYGRCGQNMARLLNQQNIPFIALDLDPERVRMASAAGDHVVYGDGKRASSLVAAGISRARALAITHQDSQSALKTLHQLQHMAPQVPALVRTVDDSEISALQAAGASVIVPEALEGSLMLTSHTLALLGVPMQQVQQLAQQARDTQYELMRGYFHGADDRVADEMNAVRLLSLSLPNHSRCHGYTVADLAWSSWEVKLLHIRRPNQGILPARPNTTLQSGDTLVISGCPAGLEEASAVLLAV